MKAHQNNTKDFNELSYSEQAKSINAQIMNIEASIISHRIMAKKDNKEDPLNTNIDQLSRLLERLKLI